MTPALPPLILLAGPTASGKTACAIHLLEQQLPVELVSVDSALVYRDMNIGTAKPDAATLARAPHHLIDLISPLEAYSAAQFRSDALQVMAEITARGKIPLLVGGTMLYYKALLEGLSDLPEADPALRAQLEADARTDGLTALHARLASLDPTTATRLHPTDSQRIQRALEICLLSGEPMSALLARQQASPLPYRTLQLALHPSDRAVLHERIAVRFRQMLQDGLLDEVRELQQRYPALHPDLPSMRCVGYRQAWLHLAGEDDLPTLIDKGIAATRQLAKRQMTWLRGLPGWQLLDCLAADLPQQVEQQVQHWLDAGPAH